jgi:hypothetical protein
MRTSVVPISLSDRSKTFKLNDREVCQNDFLGKVTCISAAGVDRI